LVFVNCKQKCSGIARGQRSGGLPWVAIWMGWTKWGW